MTSKTESEAVMSEPFTFDFACRDDCLNNMVPSDLRGIISERNRLRARVKELEQAALSTRAEAVPVEAIRHAMHILLICSDADSRNAYNALSTFLAGVKT